MILQSFSESLVWALPLGPAVLGAVGPLPSRGVRMLPLAAALLLSTFRAPPRLPLAPGLLSTLPSLTLGQQLPSSQGSLRSPGSSQALLIFPHMCASLLPGLICAVPPADLMVLAPSLPRQIYPLCKTASMPHFKNLLLAAGSCHSSPRPELRNAS